MPSTLSPHATTPAASPVLPGTHRCRCTHMHNRILMAGRDRILYREQVAAGEHYITDELEKVPREPDKRRPKPKPKAKAAGGA